MLLQIWPWNLTLRPLFMGPNNSRSFSGPPYPPKRATSFWRIRWSWKGLRVVVLDGLDNSVILVDSTEGLEVKTVAWPGHYSVFFYLFCRRSLLLVGTLMSFPLSIPAQGRLRGTTPSMLSLALRRAELHAPVVFAPWRSRAELKATVDCFCHSVNVGLTSAESMETMEAGCLVSNILHRFSSGIYFSTKLILNVIA